MELTKFLSFLATVLPIAYGAPTQAADALHPELLAAMHRDLGLSAEQATARIAHDQQASTAIEQLRSSMGEHFAGGWVDGGKFFVGVTDATKADAVKAAGATPVLMANALSKLDAAKQSLDTIFTAPQQSKAARAVSPNASIASYFVDVATNKLVIQALDSGRGRADELAKQAGLAASEYEVRTVQHMPKVQATVDAGDGYIITKAAGRFLCSVGFSVTDGFVSAGHCGSEGDTVATQGGESLGTFAGSNFPGSSDWSYVKTVDGTTLSADINTYGGPAASVSGSDEAAVGASICRSGATSQVTCGTIEAKDVTVNYGSDGSVSGLTHTTACSDHGDSGGAYYSGSQGQGVLSGGNGACDSGSGSSYFQPLNPILSNYGVSLVTA